MSDQQNTLCVDTLLARLRELGVSEFLVRALTELCEEAGQAQEDVNALQHRVETLKVRTRSGEKAIRFHTERAVMPEETAVSYCKMLERDLSEALDEEPHNKEVTAHES